MELIFRRHSRSRSRSRSYSKSPSRSYSPPGPWVPAAPRSEQNEVYSSKPKRQPLSLEDLVKKTEQKESGEKVI